MTSIPGSSARYAFDIDPEAGLALVCSEGTLTGADMQLLVSVLHADARWKPHFDAIWDCRAVATHVVRPREVKPIVDEVVESDTGEVPIGRDVLIEAGGIVDVAISQLLAALCRREGKDVRVVTTMERALDALDRAAVLPDCLQALTEAG